MHKFSVVLPCYNESANLPHLLDAYYRSILRNRVSPAEFQLILVNNGSTDHSSKVIESFSKHPISEYLKVVSVFPNRGYGYGVLQGLLAASGGAVGWSHSDGQCSAEDVFRAWKIWKENGPNTLVKGTRRGRSLGDWLFSRGFELAVLFLQGEWASEINAQPKIFHSSLVPRLSDAPTDFTFDLFVLLRAKEANYKLKTIPVYFPPRKHGQSSWSTSVRSKLFTVVKCLRSTFAYQPYPQR